uniref:Uncharacterized protein n=1 Tax=Anguilla anguilla TaxID=7936 RepID=A0A0E9U3Y6_ANGAN
MVFENQFIQIHFPLCVMQICSKMMFWGSFFIQCKNLHCGYDREVTSSSRGP